MTTRPNTRLHAFVVASFVLMSGWALAGAHDLSFDDRVAAHRAVEQVYWEHRDWPTANPTGKPPLQAVLPEAALRERVETLLRQSAQLEAREGRPLTGEELQAELDRMARETKAPDTLREIFAALHDDPFLIAECVARPALVKRLLAASSATDGQLGSDAPSSTPRADSIAPPPSGYRLPELPAGGCTNDTWSVSTLTTATGPNIPTGRQLHTAIWTGAEVIVWGGWDGNEDVFATGGRYDPATDAWAVSSLTSGTGANLPPARYRHTAVWTGTEMIVWGGRDAGGVAVNTGGRYNVATDAWAVSSLTTATGGFVPAPRAFHSAVWSGTEMIVWGGAPDSASGALNTGGLYNPATDTWRNSRLTTASAAHTPMARLDHTAVWTGTEMIVWGGAGPNGVLNDGGLYDPATDSWPNSSLTIASGAYVPTARKLHTAVWTGTEMIVWGGATNGSPASLNTGGRYDPATDTWALSLLTTGSGARVPTARQLHTATWTGTVMIVWGGSTDLGGAQNDGGQYIPATDTWALSSLTDATGANVPSPRQYHTAIWTGPGQQMVVWGGSPTTATGGLYCAACPPVPWFVDGDGDGHGDPAVMQVSCTQPAGYAAPNDDCDDTDPAVYGGAAETCNGVDDDCDTVIDDGGDALCADGDDCSADLCDPVGACLPIHQTVNLDATGFSAARVDGRDLVVLADAWNTCPGDPNYNAAANLDQGAAPPESCIDLADFHLFMLSFGQSCP